MPRIARLPLALANQIAAGEVVERPASLVKELVENAIDAGARRIAITIELGGKKLVRVEDDGCGMDAEDAHLALERHATSKIGAAADLEAIRTLGFRGEALPSIASVSHLVLRTRAAGSLHGTEIAVDGGKTMSSRDVGMPEGTAVEVRDLFYNLPARRKFLKSDAAESAQVSRVVSQIALAYPRLGFAFQSAGRKVLQCAPAADLAERFYQLHGERPDLVAVMKQAAGLAVYGYAAALADQGPIRGPQYLFVNGRIVKDRTLSHAIVQAYTTATVKERSPEIYLFIELPPERVDVNVHPTKAEVRFLDQSLVHEIVRRALAEALGQGSAPALQMHAPVASVTAPRATSIPGIFASPAGAWDTPMTRAVDLSQGSASASLPLTSGGASAAVAVSLAAGMPPMVPLGQFRDTFIIAIDADGVMIVDQHVAHERVLFEQVMERLGSDRLESQRLLQPLLIDLSPGAREALLGRAGELEQLGFEVEAFGGETVRVAAAPALLGAAETAATVRAVAEDLEGLDRGSPMEQALRRIAATMACHAAVKAHDPLTLEKMRYILDELRRTAFSTVCPHGRPVALRLTRREIEKNFGRL